MGIKYTNGTISFCDYEYFKDYMDVQYGVDAWFLCGSENEYYWYNPDLANGDIEATGWTIIEPEDNPIDPIAELAEDDPNKKYEPSLHSVFTEPTIHDMKIHFDELEKMGYGARLMSLCGMTRFYSYIPTKDKKNDFILFDTEKDIDIEGGEDE